MCLRTEKCFTRKTKQSYCKVYHPDAGLMSTIVYNSAYNYNQLCTRRSRSRKFNLNMYWYRNLYRRQRQLEHYWTLYHNPLEDMETPFLSFSNPNYQFNSHQKSNKKNQSVNNLSDSEDINIMSLVTEKQEKSKLLNGGLQSQNSIEDDENASIKSDEIVSDEENDIVDADTKLVTQDNDDEKLDNTECVNMTYGEKPKGILAYISLLEQSAKERSERRKKELENTENYMEDCDSGETTPSLSETMRQKTFANAGFDINSPDSNDSGIQSDARSDDGISNTHNSISEDMYAITNKSYLARNDEKEDSEEVTPTQTDEVDGNVPDGEETEVLPPGWERCEDEDGPYFWHIKSGTIQREPPSPAPPDMKETLRSISINSDSSTVSVDSLASTPSSSSTEDHLHEFEDHALQYAVKSLKNLSTLQRNSKYGENSTEKPVRYAVGSLGWVPIAEEDLTPERSNKAVNKCIMDLTLGRNDINDVVGRWGDGKDLYMDLDMESLRLIDTQDMSVLNYQPIHTIRVWGVGRENGRDFAYVARDNLSKNYMCHVFRCDTPARHIANTLRDICKKIMMERTLQQNALNRLTRPTDLPNIEPATTQSNGEKVTFQSLYTNTSFPTPMEEPKKVLRCHYVGSDLVGKPTGMDVLNSAIDRMVEKVPPEKWRYVGVAVAPSTITITEHGNPDNKIEECRVRYLSFMGISMTNVKLCAFIVHKAEDKFYVHVFHSDPNAGPLCKTIEAACKLRYQKCLDAQHRYLGKQKERKNRSVKAGLKNMMTTLKSPTIIQKIFTDRVCVGDKED
ncbi:amyloid beta precursor protein binding family B member 2-like isoform X2 [Ruditapes philippinarum]|uniref:amyloid beta precursor protein binding family B member 2-like isoform X2 n=1 Tax=Ruditapes philippinarum TaxID=129788 RepID=UPI00295B8716|nr:amyloid beta precursor protein binding family B member 2-like isoform X2 [Ruditapes philippinarum]